jgi:hypothetical protein
VTLGPPQLISSGGSGVIGLEFNNVSSVERSPVGALSKSCLLFALNWLDARILEHGELTFLGAKLAIGAFAAYILYRCAHLPLAKHGLSVVLGIYLLLMIVHVATGCLALGWHTPVVVLGYIGSLSNAFLSLFV